MWYVTDFAVSKKTIIIGELELGLLRVEGRVEGPREGERMTLLYEGGHVTGDDITRRGGDVTGRRRKITSPWMTSRGRWCGKDISDQDIPDAENCVRVAAKTWRGVKCDPLSPDAVRRSPPLPSNAVFTARYTYYAYLLSFYILLSSSRTRNVLLIYLFCFILFYLI